MKKPAGMHRYSTAMARCFQHRKANSENEQMYTVLATLVLTTTSNSVNTLKCGVAVHILVFFFSFARFYMVFLMTKCYNSHVYRTAF